MNLNRRDFLKAAALSLTASEILKLNEVLAGVGDPPVLWLQGQGCTGCTVSFLNTVNYATIDELLLNAISLEYDSTIMASAGDLAISASQVVHPTPAELDAFNQEYGQRGPNLQFDLNHNNVVNRVDLALLKKRGYILIVEGAIPTGAQGRFCTVGGMTMIEALRSFSLQATRIIAVGTCACYGGVSAGDPNPTGAVAVSAALKTLKISKQVINIPGCPVHPDWLVGTLSYIFMNNKNPALDSAGRPKDYFGKTVHSQCPNLPAYNANFARRAGHADGYSCLTCHSNTDRAVPDPKVLGASGCLYALNCAGRYTYADCPSRQWNSPGTGQKGVNWCIGAKSPCIGCTQPDFPDGMSPFFTLSGNGESDDEGEHEGGNERERDD
jgi:hydrogenase small subunit